ncbi:PPE family protein, partial [Mycobacterium asiaticum]
MNFSVLPPEINSLRIFAGAGSAPMLGAAAAWDGLASELAVAANSFGSITSGLATASWQGAASQAMAAVAAPYAGWLSAVTAQAEQAASQARNMASTFDAVRAAIVHPAEIAANRNVLLSLIRTNIFGFNTPAIFAAEADYELMWARDVAAMFDYYAGASTIASALTPFTQPLKALAGLPGQLATGSAAAASAA